jgi:hypothetical protein
MLSQCSSNVLLYAYFEVSFSETLSNANIEVACLDVGQTVDNVLTINAFFSNHVIIITPFSIRVNRKVIQKTMI